MELGFGLPVSGVLATPERITGVARRAEALGYRSLWSFQRLIVPTGAGLPPVYSSVLDPLLPLAFAAAVTERIRLGTAIVNLPFQPAVLLAKQLATLDVLSAGRLDAGLGLGWEPEEFAAAGVDMARRGARAEDYIACLKALWAPDPVSYDGEFTTVPEGSVLPKPVQSPHPPILLGGGVRTALERVGRLADGWISSSRADLATLAEPIGWAREAAERAGRDPDALRFLCRAVVRPGQRDGLLSGTIEQIREDLPALADSGITETFIDINFTPGIGSPDVPAADAAARLEDLLEGLAPGPRR